MVGILSELEVQTQGSLALAFPDEGFPRLWIPLEGVLPARVLGSKLLQDVVNGDIRLFVQVSPVENFDDLSLARRKSVGLSSKRDRTVILLMREISYIGPDLFARGKPYFLHAPDTLDLVSWTVSEPLPQF